MHRSALRCLTLALLLATPAVRVSAQTPAGDSARPVTAIPRAQRPTVAVRGFEFAAMLSPEDREELNSVGALVAALNRGSGNGGASDPALTQTNLARAVTSLLVERLQATQQFRLLERARLQDITGEQDLASSNRAQQGQGAARTGQLAVARYVVTGSITKFGRSKQKKRGAFGMLTRAAGMGVDASSTQTDYEIAVTANVVESSSGEVVASMTTEGKATGDKGRSISGIGGTWGGLVGGALSSSATGEREKRVAEALQRAVDAIAVQIVEARQRGDLTP